MSFKDKTLMIVVNDPGFFLSHRLPIAVAAKKAGLKILVVTKPGEQIETILANGFEHYSLPLTRSGKNIFSEIRVITALWKLLKKRQPDIIHLVTIKPVLYGGILARLTKVPAVVSAISGLGLIYSGHNSFISKLSRAFIDFAYKTALSHPNQHVIFQNTNDVELLGKTHASNKTIIPGSGVNLSDYPYLPEPEGNTIVSMASRLLKDKGAREFVAAARILKEKNLDIKMQLIGSTDPQNPRSISDEQYQNWESDQDVDCLGYRTDIAELFSNSAIIVLPSYYKEGLPKALIEAAACGRATITTNLPGCRDAIIPNKTGLLIPAKNAKALADAIESLLANHNLRENMGRAARELAEKKYSIEDVVNKHLEIYSNLLISSSNQV